MKNILIITSSIDYTVDYIINNYGYKNMFYRVNVDMFNRYKFNISYENGFYIESSQWSIGEDELDAIYYRKPLLPNLCKYEQSYHKMISKDIISYINGIVDGFDGIVLSKPSILRKTENKIYQIKIAKKVGFKFPISSIGTSLDDINKIIEIGAIIKPLTTGKIISNNECEIIQTAKVQSCIKEDISITPLYIQQYIEKSYELRVTIINNKIFPVKIESFNLIDWRIDQNKNKYTVVNIPEDIKIKCLEMMKIMNLKFGAFDFIVNNDNEYIFLEVNPNGQWLWLEQKLGVNISSEIINYLEDGKE
ncbi:hypothetical protein [Clostridium tertium]|uniref:hypothetical protein n=1 Tax=Clostridium tertium TaxID=1559 RepID=UPI000BE3CF49|nr:hypothetical protein [Clostridium tertium]